MLSHSVASFGDEDGLDLVTETEEEESALVVELVLTLTFEVA